MATATENAVGSTSSQPTTTTKFWQTNSPTTSSSSSSSSSSPFSPSTGPPQRLRISRVAQLDAQLLDTELEGILHEPVKQALQGIHSVNNRRWQPELLAILRLTILKMSLWSDQGGGGGDSTYGTSLQNLRFRNEQFNSSTSTTGRLTKLQKTGYTLLTVLLPYSNTRLQDLMLNSSWSDEPLPRSWVSLLNPTRAFTRRASSSYENENERRRRREEELIQWKREWKRSVWEFSRFLEKLSNLLGLLNFFVFLYNGKYRSLIERVLKMRLVYSQRTVSPNVSFEYLNRQLVWEAFTEFLLFLMPLINLRRIKLRISRFILNSKSSSSADGTLLSNITSLPTRLLGLSTSRAPHETTSSGGRGRDEKEGRRRVGKFSFLPSTTCPICYELSHDSNNNPPVTKLPISTISASASSIADPTNPTSTITRHHQSSTNSSNNSSNPVIPTDTSVKIPYEANPCGCKYCYYCIVGVLNQCQEEMREEQGWECLRCGEMVNGCKREIVVMAESSTRPEEEEEDEDEDEEEEEE